MGFTCVSNVMKPIKLLLLFAISLAAEQRPAAQVFEKWLAAFNSGDRASIEAFMKTYEPARLNKIDETLGFSRSTGGFTLVETEKAEGTEFSAIVKESSGTVFARIKLRLTSTPPHTVDRLTIEQIDIPASQKPQRLPLDQVVKAAEEFARSQHFAGAFLILRKGAAPIQRAFGDADRENHKPNTAETRFRIGSMNKMITSIAALQLVEKGKLQLDAPIGKVLTDYPNEAISSKVTLRHLLTHTGGTGDIFGPEFAKNRDKLRSVADYVELYGSRAPQFEPGTSSSYSNYGFVLIGALIEKASGMTYYDYVQKNIYNPAGMKHSGSFPEEEFRGQISKGYMQKDDTWVSNSDTLPWRGSPAGGGYATVGDLARFATALLDGKLLGKELFQQATTNQGKNRRPYGFGFMIHTGDLPGFGHSGGAPGMNGELQVFPEAETILVVLSNLDPPAATRVATFINNRLPLR
jgi:D-alanyl-D-alanine carboxypeptidase